MLQVVGGDHEAGIGQQLQILIFSGNDGTKPLPTRQPMDGGGSTLWTRPIVAVYLIGYIDAASHAAYYARIA